MEIRFWCDRKFAPEAKSIFKHYDPSIRVEVIVSGKLRRYHTLPIWRQLLRPFSILLPNLRDLFLVGCGFLQSLVKLLLWRPDVVFTKGGYACLPIGIAAWALKIPLVIHDSDAHPGLTNRVLARFATAIGTGAPLKFYAYPADKTHYVGTPVGEEFSLISSEDKKRLKQELGFNPKRPLLVITGGGLGSGPINDAVVKRLQELLAITSVALISGTARYDDVKTLTPQDNPDFQLLPFVSGNMNEYLGAADVAVTRAGATTTLELATLGTPAILVPSPYLTGGHQLKNAAVYAETGAVEVIDDLELEANPQLLVDTLTALLTNPNRLAHMRTAFHAYAKPHAAEDMASLISNVLRDARKK
jgi:UDP-N-acetylglucosamine--N-acetylmuramyl-(pentapeptide) pyrophosphoryl-undecaprenol N-acetylglucosamine transferase